MKTWQILAAGIAGLTVALLLPLYAAAIPVAMALAVVAGIVFGFVLRPQRDLFYVETWAVRMIDKDRYLEHGLVAVRLEIARLWLLFVPTFCGLAFLVLSSARGMAWKPEWSEYLFGEYGSALIITGRLLIAVVFGTLFAWVSERWALRNVDACAARGVSLKDGFVSYFFLDTHGDYYGGQAFAFGHSHQRDTGHLVLYDIRNPALNRIAMACVFHRLVVFGHGLTDLDAQTVVQGQVQVGEMSIALGE